MSHNHQNLLHPMPLPSGHPATMQTRSTAIRNTYSPETHRGVYCRSATSAGSTSSMTRSSRSSRAAGPLIDLTESSPGGFSNPSVGELRLPLPKRRRTLPPPAETEKVDLSIPEDENEFSLRKNREDLLKVQEGDNGGQRKKLAGFSCVICMEDEPVDLAVTPCGHMFCHLCLHGAIKASTTAVSKLHGRCPVCRGKVSLKDVIPMEFKLLSKSQGKQKAK